MEGAEGGMQLMFFFSSAMRNASTKTPLLFAWSWLRWGVACMSIIIIVICLSSVVGTELGGFARTGTKRKDVTCIVEISSDPRG